MSVTPMSRRPERSEGPPGSPSHLRRSFAPLRTTANGQPAAATTDTKDPALQKVADEMAGVFAEQLFKAMRDTVPQGEGAVDGGSGEEMFSGLMDQHLAAETPTQWARGLTDSIVRHLRGALQAQEGGAAPAGAPAGDAAPNAPRPLHEPATLDPLRAAEQLRALQQSPQSFSLQPLPDASR